MRKFATLAVVLIVTACGSLGLTDAEKAQLTPAQRVFALKGEFSILLDAVVAYAEQPRCGPTVAAACSDQAVVDKAADLATRAGDSLDLAQAAVQAGDASAAGRAATARLLMAELSNYLISRSITP
jgi:hypothetical protein